MDSVRFGRALGTGARSAARSLATAAEAAAAPNPNASSTTSKAPAPISPLRPPAPAGEAIRPAVQSAARAAAQATARTRRTKQNLARGGRRFGEAVWGPLAKLSGVLWLEMTGAFFALFALFGAEGFWRHRADLHQTSMNHAAHQHLLVYAAMTLLFTYFAATSFFRARRKER